MLFRNARRIAGVLLVAALAACGGDATKPRDTGPVFASVEPVAMSEVALATVGVSATDPQGAAVTLGLAGKPSFASLLDNGDGTGVLSLFPALGDAGNRTVTLTAASTSGTGTLDVSVSVSAEGRAPGALFYEPPSACVTGTETDGTLSLYNRSTESLIVQPIRNVVGADALNQRRVLDPQSTVDVAWTWAPGGPPPEADTLIALTNDPRIPRIVFPLHREADGSPDITAPDAPLLAAPADGAVFTLAYNPQTMAVEAEISVVWSIVDDCSGIDHYRFQIASDPGFTSLLFATDTVDTITLVVAEDGDQGTAYWRVLAVDGQGLTSVASAVRSWTVTGP